MANLVQELKRRNVFRVAAAYIVAGWLLVEIFQVLVEIYDAPAWILKLFVAVLMIGLPVVLAFSWAYEITPEGIKREEDVVRDESITHVTAKRLDSITIGLLILAIGMLAVDWLVMDRPMPTASEEPVAEVAATQTPTDDRSGGLGIAVLPFDNLSADEENAFFAGGVHEDILTYLTKVKDLRVISRTTMMKYSGQQVDLREVARDLNVSHILEGSVRRAGNRVRVTAQLIEAKTDRHLWAENFDRELADIFEIQSSVAREIVGAVGAQLSPEESRRLTHTPTDSIDAYDLYLQARQIWNRSSLMEAEDAKAQELLEAAIEIDPDFALAHALLADVHGRWYWASDRTPERLVAMKTAVDRAIELEPDLVEARMALADYYYRVHFDYPSALEQLEIAVSERPNDAALLYQLGLVLRRLGRFEESIQAFSQARRLDPGSPRHIAEELVTMESANFYDQGRALIPIADRDHPDDPVVNGRIALILLEADGPGQAVADRLAHPPIGEFYDAFTRVQYALFARDAEAGVEALRTGREPLEAWSLGLTEFYLSFFHEIRGDVEAARASRVAALELLQRSAREKENFGWPHAFAAWAHARLGQDAEARAACDRATSILPLEKDQLHGADFHHMCLMTRALLGERDELIDEYQITIGQPLVPSRARLRDHPEWDFLRDDPRFRALYED